MVCMDDTLYDDQCKDITPPEPFLRAAAIDSLFHPGWAAAAWCKTCRCCGRQHGPATWGGLRRVGNQQWVREDGRQTNDFLELRTCLCGDTISMPVAMWAAGSECPGRPASSRADAELDLEPGERVWAWSVARGWEVEP